MRASPSLSSVSSAPARIAAGSSSRHQRAVHQLLRGNGDAPQRGLVAHDPDVAVEIRDLRQPVVERNQIAQAVHRFQFVVPQQFVGDA